MLFHFLTVGVERGKTGKTVITLTTMSMSSTKYLFNICFDIKSRAPLSACWSVQIELHTRLINKTAAGTNFIWNKIKNYGILSKPYVLTIGPTKLVNKALLLNNYKKWSKKTTSNRFLFSTVYICYINLFYLDFAYTIFPTKASLRIQTIGSFIA